MRLLLDTHILLWAMLDDPRLGAGLRDTIATADSIFVSAASVWEVSIEAGLGKLDVPVDLFDRALAAGALWEPPPSDAILRLSSICIS